MTRRALVGRYGLTSGVCFLLHNLIVIVGDGLRQGLALAVMESFCIVGVVGYLLHSRFTFEKAPSWDAFLRYGAAMAMNLPVSFAILWVFAGLLQWPMALAAPVATGATIVFNFVASRWALQRDRGARPERHAC